MCLIHYKLSIPKIYKPLGVVLRDNFEQGKYLSSCDFTKLSSLIVMITTYAKLLQWGQ